MRKKMGYSYGPTDRWTDGPTDTPSYRDAWTHLKTAHIVEEIKHPSFVRQPQSILNHLTKRETKAIMIAGFRMLE